MKDDDAGGRYDPLAAADFGFPATTPWLRESSVQGFWPSAGFARMLYFSLTMMGSASSMTRSKSIPSLRSSAAPRCFLSKSAQ